MHLEIVEILTCPACGPPQRLVAFPAEVVDRRVLHGALGCPACEARYDVRSGIVRLGAAEGDSRAAADPPESPTVLAALLGTAVRRGWILLDEMLAPHASGLARLAPESEVIALRPPARAARSQDGAPDPHGTEGGAPERRGTDARGASPPPYTPLAGLGGPPLPIVDGRLVAVALTSPAEGLIPPERLEEAVRVLAPGGRLVLIRPDPAVIEHLRALPIRVLAAERRAAVAERG